MLQKMSQILLLWVLILAQASVSPADFDDLTRKVSLPLFATSKLMGQTVGQNNLTVYTLSKLPHSDLEQLQGKTAILINSYIHARQPYSVQMLKRLFEKIVADGYAGTIDHFLNEGLFIFYPFVNIDGYFQYISQPNKRDQIRKNMNSNQNICPTGVSGVDINRNFPYSFGTVSTSNNPCGEEYHGEKPFSEQEARVFQNIFQNFRVVIAIDVHSYGNEWIYPYASDSTNQKIKYTKLYPLYLKVINDLRSKNRSIKSCMQSLNYVADGVYIDWALDQGALSLAFEVGRTFRSDKDISEEIERALEDFKTIFENARFTIQAKIFHDKLFFKSTYFHTVEAKIEMAKQTFNIKLEPLSQIQISIPQNVTSAFLTVSSGKRLQIPLITSKQGQHYRSVFIIGFVLVMLILIFLGCYGCSRCKNRKATVRFGKHQFSEIVEITYRQESSTQI